ncbi:MAG TPA: hypothetical protein VFV19_13795 [Candidatus Polarisedimenticolaceae bacterium]|nr:hypothetical protein [Candidatus Polarisedimenticolaceae bacterium]
MIRRAMQFIFGAALVTAFVVGVSVFATPAQAFFGHCICPDNYAPVTCSNGVTYANSCLAGCAHATGCVRSGDI